MTLYNDDDDDYESSIRGKNVRASYKGTQTVTIIPRESSQLIHQRNSTLGRARLLRVTLPFSLRKIRGRRTRATGELLVNHCQ